MKLKYEIVYNQYQSKYVVFKTDEINFNTKGILVYKCNESQEKALFFTALCRGPSRRSAAITDAAMPFFRR